jgi:two-component system NtrC family response regulator
MARILIIDDDSMFCTMLAQTLRDIGHEVPCVHTLCAGIAETGSNPFDVVYLDVHLPDGNGLEAIPAIMRGLAEPEVIIMTAAGDPDGAELAMKNGAWDYFVKPSSLNAMLKPLVRALQYREAKMQKQPIKTLKREGIIGISLKSRNYLDLVAQAASCNANVLITGETGIGKELIARAIHDNSARCENNFIVVDCASLTETLVESVLFGYERGAYTGAERSHEGLIRQADGGTLFLDEVGELTSSLQRSFLRVLEGHSFRPLGSRQEVQSDFRLVSATNRNLEQMVREGHFREDLLYRLRAFCIELPPLRERTDDIPEMVVYQLMKICNRYGSEMKGLSPELMDMLNAYEWPGNVRELVHTLERLVAAASGDPVLFPKHLPLNIRVHMARKSLIMDTGTPCKKRCPQSETQHNPAEEILPKWQNYREKNSFSAEKEYLQQLMLLSGHNIKKACEISGLSRARIYQFLKKYPLSSADQL